MTFYLLSKDDFATLYRFGKVNVKSGAAAKSDDDRAAVEQIFSTSDNFEYAQERIIVACESGDLDRVEMKNVTHIYPLDQVSKNIYESQFDKDLIFSEPIFQDIVENFLKISVMAENTISGIDALRHLFNLGEEEDVDLIDNIIRGKSFLRNWKYFDVPFEERNPYSMLMAYNRYQHYPKDTRGYFYDAADCFMYGHMFDHLANKDEYIGYNKGLVARTCASYFKILDELPSSLKFTEIANRIDAAAPKIQSAIGQVYGSLNFMALYFYVKALILSEKTITAKVIDNLAKIRERYPEDFPRLITVIGGFFGYTWIYDLYYKSIGLSIFKVKAPASCNSCTISDTDASINNNECTIESEDSNDVRVIQIENIAALVYQKKCKGKTALLTALDEHHEAILRLTLEKENNGWEEVYKRVFTTNEKKKISLDVFIKTCHDSITYKM